MENRTVATGRLIHAVAITNWLGSRSSAQDESVAVLAVCDGGRQAHTEFCDTQRVVMATTEVYFIGPPRMLPAARRAIHGAELSGGVR